jgi:hypothetical protein
MKNNTYVLVNSDSDFKRLGINIDCCHSIAILKYYLDESL